MVERLDGHKTALAFDSQFRAEITAVFESGDLALRQPAFTWQPVWASL
jgi:hypothetical protein